MNRALAIFAAFALALSIAGAADAKTAQCKDPKTGKFIKCPPPAAAPATTPAAGGPPHCTKGVPCGKTCIAKGKVCHVH
jgi:hypothetical protein